MRYGLFVCFFPQLIAGPIVYRDEMMPQLLRLSPLRYGHLAVGITWFFFGLFKKVALADNIAVYATPVFNDALRGVEPSFFAAWLGAFAYSAQIYFDFSGYSDMAIGLGRMFGLRLPINFNTPYAARNIIDFWRRWHITLSRFLRDYLYIPLGGNRHGQVLRYSNLLTVMLIGGLWHGAGWTFVVWGSMHGLMLVINHSWLALRNQTKLFSGRFGLTGRVVGTFITLIGVVVAWVFFRVENLDAALLILRGMAGLTTLEAPTSLIDIPLIGPVLRELGFEFCNVPNFGWRDLTMTMGFMTLAIIGPNSQQILYRYHSPKWSLPNPLKKLQPVIAWRLNRPYAVLTALIALYALMDMWKQSEFIYFQF